MSDSTEADHRARSNFVQGCVQQSPDSDVASSVFPRKPPKRIVQFWNDLDRLPGDVRDCLESWRTVEEQGFELVLFDESKAGEFIHRKLGPRYKNAYDKCYHPAMQSDFFRLCYILVEGGCYVDADDVYHGHAIQHLFNDGRLKIQPLCYDMSTHGMVSPSAFTKPGVNDPNWIFYFNNNPLIAGRAHPIIELALARATLALERDIADELPDIQSTTGPGNLTKTIFDTAIKNDETRKTLVVLCDWENIATSKWPLSYRNDERNWRLSDRREYRRSILQNDKGDA
ncbi:glycosyltransferase family 32 protein [Geobacter sp. SVR]|uniref:glycosyltransferase family 32 protein n=1 Tax=Geobacter sp. SVR TaxID=2495594 RepID=UPI001563B208|nr:glycosyltransferase [Geobacter sp. SVR]